MNAQELKTFVDGHYARQRHLSRMNDVPEIYAAQLPNSDDPNVLEAAEARIREQLAGDRQQLQNFVQTDREQAARQAEKDKPIPGLTTGQNAFAKAATFEGPGFVRPANAAVSGNGLTSGQHAYAQTLKLPG